MVETAATANGRAGSGGGPCPAWCIQGHGTYAGEDDWLHVGEPVPVADGLDARLCLSVDPETGLSDGPYVLLGGTELTLEAFAAMAAALVELTRHHPSASGGRATTGSSTG